MTQVERRSARRRRARGRLLVSARGDYPAERTLSSDTAVALLPTSVTAAQIPDAGDGSNPWHRGGIDLKVEQPQIQHATPHDPIVKWERTIRHSFEGSGIVAMFQEQTREAFLSDFISREIGAELPDGWIRGDTSSRRRRRTAGRSAG